MPYLMASYIKKGQRGPVVDPGGQIASGVMVASNDVAVPQYRPPVETTYQTALAGSTPSGGAAAQTLDAQILMQGSVAAPAGGVLSGENFAALPTMARAHATAASCRGL